MITIPVTCKGKRKWVNNMYICIIPGGFTETRLEAAYQAFKKGGIDYLVTAMKNGREVGRQLLCS